MSAIGKYRSFHGRNPRKVHQVHFHIPKRLVYLGRAVAIEYECDKLNGGGDGKSAVYRHEFDRGAILCADEQGRGQLFISGKKIIVTKRGIVH
jgi:hypothetical protein